MDTICSYFSIQVHNLSSIWGRKIGSLNWHKPSIAYLSPPYWCYLNIMRGIIWADDRVHFLPIFSKNWCVFSAFILLQDRYFKWFKASRPDNSLAFNRYPPISLRLFLNLNRSRDECVNGYEDVGLFLDKKGILRT